MRPLAAWLAITLTLSAAEIIHAAASGDNFYRGKSIRIVVGFAAGGGFDAYARAIEIGRASCRERV